MLLIKVQFLLSYMSLIPANNLDNFRFFSLALLNLQQHRQNSSFVPLWNSCVGIPNQKISKVCRSVRIEQFHTNIAGRWLAGMKFPTFFNSYIKRFLNCFCGLTLFLVRKLSANRDALTHISHLSTSLFYPSVFLYPRNTTSLNRIPQCTELWHYSLMKRVLHILLTVFVFLLKTRGGCSKVIWTNGSHGVLQ